MKKLILLIAISMFVVSCNNDKDNDKNTSIVIKGSIPTSSKVNGYKVKSDQALF